MADPQLTYIRFLRWCLAEGTTDEILPTARQICWHDLFDFAKKQSLTGVLFRGLERLGGMTENKPTDDDVMEWMGAVNRIRKRNKEMDQKVAYVHRTFLSEGFRNCILKGQGNALMYPDPTVRLPGDIDIWLEGGDRKAIDYVKRLCPEAEALYHHIEFSRVKGVSVEVHYRPSFKNNFVYNARIQKFFERHADEQFSHSVTLSNGESCCTPTWRFNVVFQLCHISNHFFHEGVGLRQLVDFYYLLKSPDRQAHDFGAELSALGLQKVCGAVSHVVCHYLGLDPSLCVGTPDRRRGEVLMREILAGGNFGKYDERLLSGVYTNRVLSNTQRLVRDARFALLFPSESLSESLFRLWHIFWRKRHN